jgi:thiol:disulfide interchange protein DsbC
MFDEQLVYTDAKVTYVIVGKVYDAATRKNLTEAKMRELSRVAFDAFPSSSR